MKSGSSFVVDASVGVKWVVAEVHAEAAARLLRTDSPRIAVPAVFWTEAANALRSAAAAERLTDNAARRAFGDLTRVPVIVVDTPALRSRALDLALEMRRPVYDCLYLALAIAEQSRVVTADARLIALVPNTVSRTASCGSRTSPDCSPYPDRSASASRAGRPTAMTRAATASTS